MPVIKARLTDILLDPHRDAYRILGFWWSFRASGRPDPTGQKPVASTPGTAMHQLSTLLGAYAMAGGFRRFTNYDRCDRHQHNGRQRKRSLAILLSGDNS
jgi:hypothetical protein